MAKINSEITVATIQVSLLDYFAGVAMQGMLANKYRAPAEIAALAYQQAKDMLVAKAIAEAQEGCVKDE